MKKALPYIIGLLILSTIGFFIWKKMKEKKLMQSSASGASPTKDPKAQVATVLSKMASMDTKKRSSDWRGKVGGYTKKAAGTALKAGASSIGLGGLF